MDTHSLRYKIALTMLPGIGDVLAKKLVAYLGSPEKVFTASKSQLLKVPGIGQSHLSSNTWEKLLVKAEAELAYIKKRNIDCLFYLDKAYPERLKHCPDAPVMLYVKGNIDFNKPRFISIVGTRNATSYGKDFVDELIKNVKKRGHEAVIVSGLAYGIDIAAHKAALKYNLETVAVLAHGLKTLYPAEHKETAKKIHLQGALITDFMSDMEAEKNNFVKRNRIIAGISDATLVVESAERGGALITAHYANSYNRDVFAFPGRKTDKYSAGCNKLIKTHQASLIEDITDLEYLMSWETHPGQPGPFQKQLFVELDEEERDIVEILKEGRMPIDFIAIKMNQPVSRISSLLLNLEFKGVTRCLPGKVYALN